MTLFTKRECALCERLKKQFDLRAMGVDVEVLDIMDAGALAHLAWHGLVETARKTLPILVLDDSSTIASYPEIEFHLRARSSNLGIAFQEASRPHDSCASGRCAL